MIFEIGSLIFATEDTSRSLITLAFTDSVFDQVYGWQVTMFLMSRHLRKERKSLSNNLLEASMLPIPYRAQQRAEGNPMIWDGERGRPDATRIELAYINRKQPGTRSITLSSLWNSLDHFKASTNLPILSYCAPNPGRYVRTDRQLLNGCKDKISRTRTRLWVKDFCFCNCFHLMDIDSGDTRSKRDME